jgi:predicted branched-subunit amino acid permease
MTTTTSHADRATGRGTRAAAEGRRELLTGARAMLPWLVGVVPFGFVIGVTIAESSVPHLAGWASGVTIYAGSAQLAAIELLDQGAAPISIIATVLIVNARLIVYSGSIALHWADTGRGFRALGAYLLVDPSFAVGMDRYREGDDRSRSRHAHYLGGAVTLWVAWQLAIVAGLTVGARLPASLQLEYVVPLFLIAEASHSTRTRPALAAAMTGAVVAVAGRSLPMHSGLIVAIAAGLGMAALADRRDASDGGHR